jgi:3'(2'), 5'-bisphosphate nucleotidase
VISEEQPVGYEDRKDWDTFFLVDPLDGTKDFIDKNGEFTVNIALIKNKKPVLGVIYAPALGELYAAVAGEGAVLEKNNRTYRLPCSQPGSGERTVTGSRKHRSPLDATFQELNDIQTVVPRGSSLKFCAVASGAATLYPRFQGSMEWDIAAGHIIATESGCGILDLTTGREPDYNKKSLLNNYFIVHAGSLDPSSLHYPENYTISSAENL